MNLCVKTQNNNNKNTGKFEDFFIREINVEVRELGKKSYLFLYIISFDLMH